VRWIDAAKQPRAPGGRKSQRQIENVSEVG
jgi:hypothetical protein